jgi:hypothetical protein
MMAQSCIASPGPPAGCGWLTSKCGGAGGGECAHAEFGEVANDQAEAREQDGLRSERNG